jgi:hypothetical protein
MVSKIFNKIESFFIAYMPRAKARRFTEKEERQAKHIASSEKKRGKSPKAAKRIGYATVNKNKKS